jgi:hypothetical protein
MLLVPKQGTETHDLAEDFWLNRTGTFALQLEYTSSAGVAKQCSILSSLVVKCDSSEREIDGQCYPIVQSACDQAQVSFSVADDPAKGARSLIQAALSLPAGATASVTATPQNSTVALPLQRVGSGGGWQGSVALPTTGQWSIGLTIGREQCIAKTATFDMQCMKSEGFISDGRGRCTCPAGYENVNGRCTDVKEEDPCESAVAQSMSETRALHRDTEAVVLPGDSISVRTNVSGAVMSQETLLVPTEGTLVHNVSDPVQLHKTGSFTLQLRYSVGGGASRQCSLISKLMVRCGQDEQEVDGKCLKAADCSLDPGTYRGLDGKCQRRPLLAVKAASIKLSMTVQKRKDMFTAPGAAEVRLVSGDVDPGSNSSILWSARSGAPWLQLQGAQTGIVDSDEPVAALSVLATAKGMADTAISGPIKTIVTVSSSMPGQAESVFENASHVLNMQVELTIIAVPYVFFFGKHFYRSDQPKTADGRPPRRGAHRNWTSRRKAKPDAEKVPLARWVVLPSTSTGRP